MHLPFLKADSPGDYITFSGFCQALSQLGNHSHCIRPKELDDLWAHVDMDGDGVVDHKEFQYWIWSPSLMGKPQESPEIKCSKQEVEQKSTEGRAFGFSVKDAVLFPPEAEKGTWREDYSLSDHAPLTVIFSPVRLHRSHKPTR